MQTILKYLAFIGCVYAVKGAGLEIETLDKPEKCKQISKQGDWLKVHYKGTLASDGSQFDSSYDRGDPFEFLLGNEEVIKGWDQGLIGMCKGEKRRLTVPPEMGYGKKGAGEVIPGDATLIFEIELVAIENAPKPNNIFKDIDKDSDNLLSQDEVASYFTELAMHYGEAQDLIRGGELDGMIANLFQQQDSDKDGFLTENEYTRKGNKDNKEEL